MSIARREIRVSPDRSMAMRETAFGGSVRVDGRCAGALVEDDASEAEEVRDAVCCRRVAGLRSVLRSSRTSDVMARW